MSTTLFTPCCDKCTHSPDHPCRYLIECAQGTYCCHDDAKCKELRAARLSALKAADEVVFHVGTGTCGLANGASAIIKTIEEFCAANNIKQKIIGVGCAGYCQREVLVDITMPGQPRLAYCDLSPENAEEFLKTFFIEKNWNNKWFLGIQAEEHAAGEWANVPLVKECDFFKFQKKVVLGNCGIIDPLSLDDAIKSGTFTAISKVLSTMTPEQVCQEVLDAGLRGRGGAGFPTGKKWQIAQQQKDPQKYLICNADEGDPGAFMDRAVIEGDPFRLIEGMMLGAYVIGANHGYVYCRAEYPLAIERLTAAIETCRKVGLLGTNILDSGFTFDITIKKGAGAFVCGEETAILASIEGGRGMPRPRPPFPAVKGLFGHPTCLNNVETLSNIAPIVNMGAKAFKAIGTEMSGGTKVFALSGAISTTGLVEVPIGYSLRDLLEKIGGGATPGHHLKAVQIGGPSGGCIPYEHMDVAIDYETLKQKGAMMGSGGLVVMDERTCMVDVAKFFMEFIKKESCGKCVPCREGTTRMYEILKAITEKPTTDEEREARIRGYRQLKELATTVGEASLCGLGQTSANPILATLRYFQNEYEAHINDNCCPTDVCLGLRTYTIDADKCIGCTLCAKKCPVGAISGSLKKPHVIDKDVCTGCGSCAAACKKEAIRINKCAHKEA